MLKLAGNNHFRTTWELSKLHINTVLKQRLSLDGKQTIKIQKQVIDWLTLHEIEAQSDFCVTRIFWAGKNIKNYHIDRAEKISDALKAPATEVLYDIEIMIGTSSYTSFSLQRILNS